MSNGKHDTHMIHAGVKFVANRDELTKISSKDLNTIMMIFCMASMKGMPDDFFDDILSEKDRRIKKNA